ncbi:uncharacterized protein si:ch211-227n13.3 [Pristis pectinata]|uniref:uncharacterized protein si:ch211-227n13.3 n=1 Tax=Pristis pectinata TaxID=685728 RepID=UPI00223DB9D3|nr:uncharacterized protein si:ch211-227n13.3 [Pristis pectinata]
MRKQRSAAAGSLQQSQPEFESAFQELYKSLLSSQEKVAANGTLKEKYCACITTHKDSDNFVALQKFPPKNTRFLSKDIHKTECSIQSEHVMPKDSSSNVATAGIYSTTAETAKLSAKTHDVNFDTFLVKAESNTETGFSAVRQILPTSSSPTFGDEGKTSEALHDDDGSISINSGEDYRETVTCEACSKMFWKMVNKKRTRKKQHESGKKQPYDPTSLSCDQWVLKKPLLPRGNMHKYRREIESPVKYLKSLRGSAQAKETMKWIPQCSRPHVFLHRNLRSCKRKVDEFLHASRKKWPQKKVRKRSRKKNLFVYMLPEASPSASVLSDNEDSEFELEVRSVKRKLASAVLNREARLKKDGCGFSDDSNTIESGFCSSDSKSMQYENSTCSRQDKLALDLFGPETSAFSTSTLFCTENNLHSQYKDPRSWEETPNKNSIVPLSSSFGWLKPGGFTSMIAKLKAGHQTLQGSVVKET